MRLQLENFCRILWLRSRSTLSALLNHSILGLRLMKDKDRMTQ